MKVYWAGIFTGDYIRSLKQELTSQGVEIVEAHEEFLQKQIPPDALIHVHWLEAYGTSKHIVDDLQDVLSFYKGRNSLIWTAHNLQPHDMPLQKGREFYQALIPFFDAAIHLGSPSIAKVEEIYDIPKTQQQLLCLHHILPSEKDPGILTPWSDAPGTWITLGRIRSRADKLQLGNYAREAQLSGKTLYVHRYPHLLQRRIFKNRFFDPQLLLQESKWRWFAKRVHLNFGFLEERELAAWIQGAERLLLPRTAHLNSGIPFLAAPFRIPIQVPDTGNIPWQLKQLGYEQHHKDVYHSINPTNWAQYQESAISQWRNAYRTVNMHT